MKKINYLFTEKGFFWVILILNCIPVLSNKFFPTLDGAAHLYNSNIINNLLQKNNLLSQFFVLTHEPVPNWTGHFILSVFNYFLPAFIAEKIVLLFYLIALPLAFRQLIKTIAPQNVLFSYFIFPFTYSFVFFLGFYNFSLALIFIFVTLAYWIKNQHQLSSAKTIVKLFLLFTLTYFSHIFVFAILVLFIAVHILITSISKMGVHSLSFKVALKGMVKKSVVLLVSAVLPLILLANYFLSRSATPHNTFLLHSQLTDWLKCMRPIIALNFIDEQVFTQKIVYIIVSLFVITLYNRINEIKLGNGISLPMIIRNSFLQSDFWLVASAITLLMYFKLPDSDGAAGYVSVRLAMLFYLFFILWLSAQTYSKRFLSIAVICLLYLHFKRDVYYTKASRALNTIAVECNNAVEFIKPNSVVLTINNSDNWIQGHFSNYLGIDKPMIILDNYECATGYFPVKWNDESLPNTMFGNVNGEQLDCLKWKTNLQHVSFPVDYIFELSNQVAKNDSCSLKIENEIVNNYNLVYHSANCSLYELSKRNQ